jgi:hypothetical protein
MEYYVTKKGRRLHYKFNNIVDGYKPALVIGTNKSCTITPATEWNKCKLSKKDAKGFDGMEIQKRYLLTVSKVEPTP